MRNVLVTLLFIGVFCSGGVRADTTTEREFRLAVDGVKGKVFILYNKALRENPGLSGKVAYDISIDKSGNVIECKVKRSQLRSEKLEKDICNVFKSKIFSSLSTLPYKTQYEFNLVSY